MKKFLPVLGLFALLLALYFLRKSGMIAGDDGKREATQKSLEALAESLQQFKLHNYVYPTNEQGLKALFTAPADVRMWRGPYAQEAQLKDAWGQDFQYETTEAYGFRLLSLGEDGKAASEDDQIFSNTP